ncbi:hypothetical protein Ocin01_10492 [Orchesella cincta]|uniref:ascorbate ferrireductase (transmembrane) n=1 Tax=Orchesella cincta TaxID=48709 RepID=A0A1D2MT57_ORCCI|nr:hypothetical protein Ocin01_10492 [Orchesella cincta]
MSSKMKAIVLLVVLFLIIVNTSPVKSLEDTFSSVASSTFSSIVINTAHLDTTVKNRTKRQIGIPTDYKIGCGETDACTSEGTWDDKECPFIVKWNFIPPYEYMRFQLIRLRFNKPPASCQPRSDGTLLGYIAIGFSAHNSKDDNVFVVECSITDGTPDPVKAVTFGWVDEESDDYVHWDEVLSLTFYVPASYKDLKMLDTNVSHLTPFIFFTGGYAILRSTWTMVHGSMMTLAWVVCVPNGMFFARYFKESYVQVPIFKYRPWFAIHTLSTILACVLCLVGFIAMIEGRSEIKFEWPKSATTRLHYQSGFAALFLLAGLVFTGWLRFAGRRARRIFAFAHFISGIICYIFSMVTIGYSHNLGMTCRISAYTIVIVMWSIICHVAMMVHFYFLDKRLGLYIKRANYPFPLTPVTYDELPGSRIRLIIISVHVVGTVFMASLILIDYNVRRLHL